MANDLKLGDLRGTIRGVVHPTEGFAVDPGRWFWTRQIRLRMIAWRLDGRPVTPEFLFAVREVPIGTTALWRRRAAPGTVVAFESTGMERGPRGSLRLPLTRFLGAASDPELLDAVAPMLRRDVLETAEFGSLVREPGGADYSGRCAWHGTVLELSLFGADRGEVGRSLADARALHASWAEWEARLRALVTRELLPLWRDWNPDEKPVDGDTLFGMFPIDRIWIMGDGEVQLTMDAGGQFTDHVLTVDGTVEGGPTDIYPEG